MGILGDFVAFGHSEIKSLLILVGNSLIPWSIVLEEFDEDGTIIKSTSLPGGVHIYNPCIPEAEAGSSL